MDSSNGVSLYPEYDFKEKDKKTEVRDRTPSGAEYVYKFGSYGGRSFGVTWVDSSTKAIVNSWWVSNTALLFMREGDTAVFSCRLTNDNTPVNQLMKPYHDQWKGTIELETY